MKEQQYSTLRLTVKVMVKPRVYGIAKQGNK